MSYAVVWTEVGPDAPVGRGRLDVLDDRLRLVGSMHGRPITEEIPLDGISGVRVGRSGDELVGGRRSVAIDRFGLPQLLVSSVLGIGELNELVQVLAGLVP
jgi:hypothetical protein